MAEHKIRLEYRKIDELIPYENNAKLHPPEQIAKLVRSFDEFGRIVPAGIDTQGHLIFGHGRILAARERGDKDFPCVVIDHLSEAQRRRSCTPTTCWPRVRRTRRSCAVK